MKEFFYKYWNKLKGLFKDMGNELIYESLPIIYIGDCGEIPEEEWVKIAETYGVK